MTRSNLSTPVSFSAQTEALFTAFEAQWSLNDEMALEKYWKQVAAAESLTALTELIRLDMELASEQGVLRSASDYLQRFPVLQSDRLGPADLWFEEYRLRVARGEAISAAAFAAQWGLEQTEWLSRVSHLEPSSARENARKGIPSSSAGPLRDTGEHDPDGFPKWPGKFSRFELIGLLGQGALGRVYLARQDDLADRFVALKVTREFNREPQRLARLQHTNIVPIHSVHRVGELQAICMPFLGIMTLGDLERSGPALSHRSRRGRELVSTVAGQRDSTVNTGRDKKASEHGPRRDIPAANERYASIGDRDIPETLAWMFEELADGLAYAHSHSILHGDIKPANILLGDDGHPRLLDFHLSQSTREDHRPDIWGGTLPYMSAEHLEAFQTQGRLTEGSDIFSLGAVFYRLFTHQYPYPIYSDPSEMALPKMISDRQRPATPVRKLAPEVDLDLATIIEQCLAPKSEQRYRSAGELAVDLHRHNDHRPLQFAPNRSYVHRVRKWVRRNPGVKSMSSIVSVLVLLLAAALAWGAYRSQQVKFRDAAEQSRQFVDQLQRLRLPLTSLKPTRQVLQNVTRELSVLGGGQDGLRLESWQALPRIRWLGHEQRAQEREQVAALYLQMSSAALRRVRFVTSPPDREKMNEIAESSLQAAFSLDPELATSAAGLLIQSDLAISRENPALAAQLQQQAESTQPQSVPDQAALAGYRFAKGDWDAALAMLLLLVEQHPLDVEAWTMLGNLQALAGQLEKAEASFTVCIGLDPRLEMAYYNRGNVRRELGRLSEALDDFTAAINHNPFDSSNFANRGLIQMSLENNQQALDDFQRALELGVEETRIHQRMATVLRRLNREADAQQEIATFLEKEPTDEDSFVERGIALLQQGRLDDALRDFESALKINPRSVAAWQTRAHVYSEMKHEMQPAVDSFNRILEIMPGHAEKLATRGVLQARQGNHESALQDVQAALAASQSADTLYRVAGVYALLSAADPAHKERAVRLLAASFLIDPSVLLKYLEEDPDLELLKEEPVFKELKSLVSRIGEMSQAEDSNRAPNPDQSPTDQQ